MRIPFFKQRVPAPPLPCRCPRIDASSLENILLAIAAIAPVLLASGPLFVFLGTGCLQKTFAVFRIPLMCAIGLNSIIWLFYSQIHRRDDLHADELVLSNGIMLTINYCYLMMMFAEKKRAWSGLGLSALVLPSIVYLFVALRWDHVLPQSGQQILGFIGLFGIISCHMLQIFDIIKSRTNSLACRVTAVNVFVPLLFNSSILYWSWKICEIEQFFLWMQSLLNTFSCLLEMAMLCIFIIRDSNENRIPLHEDHPPANQNAGLNENGIPLQEIPPPADQNSAVVIHVLGNEQGDRNQNVPGEEGAPAENTAIVIDIPGEVPEAADHPAPMNAEDHQHGAVNGVPVENTVGSADVHNAEEEEDEEEDDDEEEDKDGDGGEDKDSDDDNDEGAPAENAAIVIHVPGEVPEAADHPAPMNAEDHQHGAVIGSNDNAIAQVAAPAVSTRGVQGGGPREAAGDQGSGMLHCAKLGENGRNTISDILEAETEEDTAAISGEIGRGEPKTRRKRAERVRQSVAVATSRSSWCAPRFWKQKIANNSPATT